MVEKKVFVATVVTALFAACIALFLSGCLQQQAAQATPSAPTSSEAPNVVKVVIKNHMFNPSELTVAAGTTVEWVNEDDAPHDVVFFELGVESPLLAKGNSFKYTFNKTGTFDYHCSIHEIGDGWLEEGVVIVR